MMNSPEDLIEIRHKIHQNPELSGEEYETADRIVNFLHKTRPTQVFEGLGGTGVAAVYQFEDPSPTVMFRCELDALPIPEQNSFEYKSVNNGVSHKCGHDGHMAIMLGLATELAKENDYHGRVVLLFQPSEENGAGARRVIEDKMFTHINPDFVFSLHNVPGYDKHEILCKPSSFTPAVISVEIKLTGKESHAAQPENGINPAYAAAEILAYTKSMQNTEDENLLLITPVHVDIGKEAYGTAAGSGYLRFTLRTWQYDGLKKAMADMETAVNEIASKHQLLCSSKWMEEFVSNTNDPQMFEIVKRAANEAGFNFNLMNSPFRWGEDFGAFTDRYKGAMFGLGAGKDTPALHNPDYDFPDELISTGTTMFKKITDLLLKK